MVRTQISLEEEQKRRLDREAARTGRSLSDLIREAVDQVYPEALDLESALSAIDAAAGAWADRSEEEAVPAGRVYVERMRKGRPLA